MNDQPDDAPVFTAIRALLDGHGVAYRTIHHEPTTTSAASASARGEPLEVGGKAIVLTLDDAYKLIVLSAARKPDSAAVKKRFAVRKSRFASPDELMKLTGLVPGAVPPFGRPVLDLDLYVDESVTRNERIAFNAGSLTDSIVMGTDDYLRVCGGEVVGSCR